MAGEKILIADDDEDVRELLVDRLRAMGYEVSIARDGKEGLDGIELKRKRLELQHMLGGEKHPDADKDDGMLEPSRSRRVSDPSDTD